MNRAGWQAIAKFTADTVGHALHGGPTVDGLLSERLVYRLFRKVEVQHFGQQREAVDFLWQCVDQRDLSSASERVSATYGIDPAQTKTFSGSRPPFRPGP